MFCVDIKRNCPHTSDCCSEDAGLFLEQRETIRRNRCAIAGCTSDIENWMCANCMHVHCSRHVNGHALAHANANATHCIAVSLADLSVWCYKCESYISCGEATSLISCLHEDKFGAVLPQAIKHTDEEELLISSQNQKSKRKRTSKSSNSNNNNDYNNSNNSSSTSPTSVHGSPIDPTELNDSIEKVARDADKVAKMMKKSNSIVWFTGAGISTNSNIPDFRGPNGLWTLKAQGRSAAIGIKLEQATPTPTHRFIAARVASAPEKHHVISQNVDGLHLRSGLAASALSELHGNAFQEKCSMCRQTYQRDFDVVGHHGIDIPITQNHATGRKCACGGALLDTIVSFGENLPSEELETAMRKSKAADLFIVLGSSLRVTPAADLPALALANGAKLVIVNKQPTPLDEKAHILVHTDIDEFIELVQQKLQ